MNGINLLYATTAMEYIYNKVRIQEEQQNNSLMYLGISTNGFSSIRT